MLKRSLLILASLAVTAPAFALNIEFDDLTSFDFVGDYQGFTFTDFYVLSQDDNEAFYGNTYPFPSFDKAVYNGFGVTQFGFTKTDGSDFSFDGAFFAAFGFGDAFADYSARQITVYGYDNGNLVGAVGDSLDADGLNYISAEFLKVDAVSFVVSGGDIEDYQFILADSFLVGEPVPEPATMAALGLGALAMLRRRKKA